MPEKKDDAPVDVDLKAMEMIKASGVLNPKMPLEEVLNLTEKLQALHASAPRAIKPAHTDTFIHSHFIYKHED
ncbi:MAG: hypothetical protein WA324_02455 [Bryobacteraceae bacterium]